MGAGGVVVGGYNSTPYNCSKNRLAGNNVECYKNLECVSSVLREEWHSSLLNSNSSISGGRSGRVS